MSNQIENVTLTLQKQVNLRSQEREEQNIVLSEFRQSAIPEILALTNVEWIEGNAAVQILSENAIAQLGGHAVQYATRSTKRILDRYEFAKAGGWVAYGTTLDGGKGTVAYFKAKSPRRDPYNFSKIIKYETEAKGQALPILPFVDSETAQKFYQLHKLEPLVGETFWQVIYRCGVPIAITEGLKKALSLIAHGVAAIALRGIHCWHKKGSRELHQTLSQFVTPGRKFFIVFDQDAKASTQLAVYRQTVKLGEELEKLGCAIEVVNWDKTLGKGIDDAIFFISESGESGTEWLRAVIKNAVPLPTYRKLGRSIAAQKVLQEVNILSYPVERETTGQYLPELPGLEFGKIHVLTASMGSGKTRRIGHDYVQSWKDIGGLVIVLAPLNSLGRQTAKDFEIPHIHDFGTGRDEQIALWSLVAHDGGLVLCPDSLGRLPEWIFQKDILLVIDEAQQVATHCAEGSTFGSAYSSVLEQLARVSSRAIESGAIVLSEDGLSDRTVNFWSALAGGVDQSNIRVFKHQKEGQPWQVTVFSGQASGFRARLKKAVADGKPILVVTSSQREAKRLNRVLIQEGIDKDKVVRIDSETNEQGAFNQFFDSPDDWLQENQPKVLILSPSAKSGVSIEGGVSAESAYFKQVWGYFPALDLDTHWQLLGRFRPAVPRFVFIPPFILQGPDESLLFPRTIKRKLAQNLRGIAKLFEVEDIERDQRYLKIEGAISSYLSLSRSVVGAQKMLALEFLVNRLAKAGHLVTEEKLEKCPVTKQQWDQVQEEIWREDALEFATAVIDPEVHTEKWAYSTLDKLEVGRSVRILAQKVLYRVEFPGVSFDCPDQCYTALIKDWGACRRGVRLHAQALNLEAVKLGDAKTVQGILKQNVRAGHKLPKNYLKAYLLAQTGVLDLIGSRYSNNDRRAQEVKERALTLAGEIGYWLKLQIKPSQSPVEIVNKLLRKVTVVAMVVGKPGRREDKRQAVWLAEIENSVHQQLLAAATNKLSGGVSSICDRGSFSHTLIEDTGGKSSLVERFSNLLDGIDPEDRALIEAELRSAQSEDQVRDILELLRLNQRQKSA